MKSILRGYFIVTATDTKTPNRLKRSKSTCQGLGKTKKVQTQNQEIEIITSRAEMNEKETFFLMHRVNETKCWFFLKNKYSKTLSQTNKKRRPILINLEIKKGNVITDSNEVIEYNLKTYIPQA